MSFGFGHGLPFAWRYGATGGGPSGGNGDGSALNDENVDFNIGVAGNYFTAIDGSALNDSSIDFDLETA